MPRPGGADAEDHVAALHCLEIAHLVEAARRQRLAAEIALAAAVDEVAEAHLRVLAGDLEEVFQITVAEAVALMQQGVVVGEQVVGALDPLRLALDLDAVVEQVGGDVEDILEKAYVLVVGSEEGLEAL